MPVLFRRRDGTAWRRLAKTEERQNGDYDDDETDHVDDVVHAPAPYLWEVSYCLGEQEQCLARDKRSDRL
jgi:hypothetical protein